MPKPTQVGIWSTRAEGYKRGSVHIHVNDKVVMTLIPEQARTLAQGILADAEGAKKDKEYHERYERY